MKRLFFSLRSRIFFAVAALLVASGVLIGWLSIHQQTASLKQALIDHGQSAARHLAYGSELAVLTRDADSLNSLIRNILHGKNAVFAEVYDAQGNLLASALAAGDQQGTDPDMLEAETTPSSTESWSRISDSVYEFHAPITSDIALTDEATMLDTSDAQEKQQLIGSVHLALSSKGIQQATAKVIRQGVITLLLLLLVSLVITWWMARVLTERLERIAGVADQIGAGNLDQRIEITGEDEISQLGQVLNRMLGLLAERDAELHAQQRVMRTILDQAPIGIWMLDINGRIRFINPAFSHAFGIDEQRFLAAPHYKELLDDAIVDQCVASDHACFSSGQVYSCVEQIPVEGKTRHYDIIKVPVRDDQGKIDALIGLAIDITPRIEAEAEKATMQKQVEHTQRLESLGVLAGGIAHDFNNILAAIMGNAALAKQKISRKDADAGVQHLARIEQASEKAALLCRQMLAYSGKGHFVIKPLNLTEMVKGITSLLEVSIHGTINLCYRMEDNLPPIEADEAQMQQVIMNLVINASDAIGEQSGTIMVVTGVMEADSSYLNQAVARSGEDLPEGKYVVLEISDTGCGMDSDTQQRLFEPFFTTKFTGRGLGMSAVLGIVRGHHGAMMVYSEVGRGTSFKVLFPVADCDEEVAVTKAPASAQEWRGEGAVLVVDDEATIRETAAAMLEDMGFTVLEAADGVEAVEVFRRQPSEIVAVLLDMTMPRLDGAGCFQQLKEIDPQVRVILSSGYNEQESLRRVGGSGLAGFIQKPYWPEALEAKMREVTG